MKKAYIIGPYRDDRGVWFVNQNINRARKLAAYLWQQGYAVFCPHSNASNFDGLADDSVWLEGDLEWLKCADVAFVVPGEYGLKDYSASSGSINEIKFCEENKIKVIKTYWNQYQMIYEFYE